MVFFQFANCKRLPDNPALHGIYPGTFYVKKATFRDAPSWKPRKIPIYPMDWLQWNMEMAYSPFLDDVPIWTSTEFVDFPTMCDFR